MFSDNYLVHINEQIPYDQFSSNKRQLNHKQKLILDDNIYKKKKSTTIFHFFYMRYKHGQNIYINVYHTKYVTIFYIRNNKSNPLKPKIMKLTYIRKTTFHINGTIIHSTFTISLNKKYNELKANDKK